MKVEIYSKKLISLLFCLNNMQKHGDVEEVFFFGANSQGKKDIFYEILLF
jgi:hypothetical protein